MTSSTTPTALVWAERCMWYDTSCSAGPLDGSQAWIEPGAPGESPEARRRLKSLLDASRLSDVLQVIAPVDAPDEIAAVHSEAYLERVRAVSADGGGLVGPNAAISVGSHEIAVLAAGAAAAGVDAVMRGSARNAYVLARPAGHHATRNSGGGNCVFNNVAVAALRATLRWGADRIAIVDWDVHHGNGTQDIFFDDPRTLTISIHQEDWYPRGSGSVEEIGQGSGVGANVNIPLPAGSGCGAYREAFDKIVGPRIRSHRPDLIVVACGYDASAMDPYGRMLLTSQAFGAMTEWTMGLADELCEGRLVVNHEGGYAPLYVPFCGLAVVERLSRTRTQVCDPYLARYSGAFQHLTDNQSQAVANAVAPSEMTR